LKKNRKSKRKKVKMTISPTDGLKSSSPIESSTITSTNRQKNNANGSLPTTTTTDTSSGATTALTRTTATTPDILDQSLSPSSSSAVTADLEAIHNISNNNNSYKSNKQNILNDDIYPIKRVTLATNYQDETDLSLNDMNEDLFYVPKNCAEQVEQFAKYVWESGWKAMPHHALPNWLRDNDFLLKGHRPPLPSAKACFKSVFRIHTETGNIWTHFIGALSFVGIAIYFLTRPHFEIKIQEKLIFGTFFAGAIACMTCSALFHTFYCYSPKVSKLFNK
jgi:hypothetical protein